MKSIRRFFESHTQQIVDHNHSKFRLYPKWSIWMILYLSYNVLLQGVADVVLKVLSYTPFLMDMPWRTDFISLTAISVLMGYQALKGMRRREIDVTRNSISLGVLVETGLVIGDIEFIWLNPDLLPGLLLIRLPFMLFTFSNIIILLYIARKLSLFRDDAGKFVLT